MKIKVQAKDLIDVLKEMDPNAVVFEFELTIEEIAVRTKEKQLNEWSEQVRNKIREVGIQAYFDQISQPSIESNY